MQVKDDDQQKVEQHVEDAAADQRIDRARTVALTAKDRGAEIIEHDKGHAQEINAQVKDGEVQDIFRRIHERQHGPCDADPHKEQEDTADQCNNYRRVYSCGNLLLPPAPDQAGDDDISAD